MLTFDLFFNIWMTLAAVLVFLKLKKLIVWDWGIVLAPACVGILFKLAFAFFSRA
ncbi:MAG: hypothetical protein MUC98_02575 [Desulfobacterota bacterium]|jgi:hypothetical protein|nr:hypothetical protein [Thermodesulfobacteriota bacterium]